MSSGQGMSPNSSSIRLARGVLTAARRWPPLPCAASFASSVCAGTSPSTWLRRFRALPIGGCRDCPSRYPPSRSNGWWRAAIEAVRRASAITPFSCCWRDSACVPVRSWRCAWRIWIGRPRSSPCKPPALRAATYSTLLGLMAVTGMRMSEPIGLDRDDVDLAGGGITIRRSKFGKSRHVPIERSTQQALQQYQRRRDQLCRHPQCPAFFLSEQGTRVTPWALRRTFIKLSHQIALRGPSDRRGPRLHDFRHYPDCLIIPRRWLGTEPPRRRLEPERVAEAG
jgi:hypothetical protein